MAAYASKANIIGAIGGTTLCASCVRYIQGYELGAKSIKPNIKVKSAYVTNDFSAAAFNDPAGGKTFAETFIKTNKVDVLFQVAGKTGNGVLEAACAEQHLRHRRRRRPVAVARRADQRLHHHQRREAPASRP